MERLRLEGKPVAEGDFQEPTDVVGTIRDLMMAELIRQDNLSTAQAESIIGYLFDEKLLNPEELLRIIEESTGG